MRSTSARFRPVLIAVLALGAALALTACNADTEPATNVTSTSAVLHADGNGEKGEVVTFWFRYREVGTQAWQETQHIGPTGEFGNDFTNADLTATVTGLKPETTYEYFLCGTLHKPYEAGTPSNPICFDDVKGPTNQVSTFTTDEAPVTNYTLNVSKAGYGSGTVTGSGISCGSDCSQSYASGTSVTLTAAAASGSTFAGWSGSGCSGTGSCVVSMTQARSVTATFNTTPSGGDAMVVPGTGAILGQDLSTDPNPSNVWGAMDSPVSRGYEANGETDPYFERRSASADPHVPVGQTQPSTYYRRLSADGKVSVGDLTRNPSHTRTQMQHVWFEGSVDHNQFDFAPGGDYVFYMSYRIEPGVHPEEVETRGGNNSHTQLFQFKNFGEGQGNSQSPPFAGYVGSNGIGFKTSDINENKTWTFLHSPTGQWVRIAMVVNWDSNGWYEVWSDLKDKDSGQLDPNGGFRRVISRQTGINFMENGMTRAAFCQGLYHGLGLFDGTVSGHPKQPLVWTDYANAQMTVYNGQ